MDSQFLINTPVVRFGLVSLSKSKSTQKTVFRLIFPFPLPHPAKIERFNTIMTSAVVHDSPLLMAPPPPSDHESTIRGRKRDRSMTRPSASIRAIRCAPSDESSTLRGRSRHRATSPWGSQHASAASRASSPSLLSPTRKRLLHVRLRREHCPSRIATPPAQEQQRTLRRRQRTRSRSRGPQYEMDKDGQKLGDILSGLRHQIRAAAQGQTEESEDER